MAVAHGGGKVPIGLGEFAHGGDEFFGAEAVAEPEGEMVVLDADEAGVFSGRVADAGEEECAGEGIGGMEPEGDGPGGLAGEQDGARLDLLVFVRSAEGHAGRLRRGELLVEAGAVGQERCVVGAIGLIGDGLRCKLRGRGEHQDDQGNSRCERKRAA